METTKKIELGDESKKVLKRALIGVKDKREEAFILLTATLEEYLPDMVETLRILNGLKNSKCRHGFEKLPVIL